LADALGVAGRPEALANAQQRVEHRLGQANAQRLEQHPVPQVLDLVLVELTKRGPHRRALFDLTGDGIDDKGEGQEQASASKQLRHASTSIIFFIQTNPTTASTVAPMRSILPRLSWNRLFM